MHNTAMTFSFGTAKLLDYVTDMEALESSDNPIAWVTLAHALTQRARHDADKLYVAKRHLTQLLFMHGWRERRIIVLFDVINWMMTLPEPYERRYLEEVIWLAKEGGMKKLFNPLEQMLINDGIKIGLERGIEQGIERGMERGIEQGLAQGRKEGATAILERQLVRRFGPLPPVVSDKLAKASLAQVEVWSDALVTAQSLKQLFHEEFPSGRQ